MRYFWLNFEGQRHHKARFQPRFIPNQFRRSAFAFGHCIVRACWIGAASEADLGPDLSDDDGPPRIVVGAPDGRDDDDRR